MASSCRLKHKSRVAEGLLPHANTMMHQQHEKTYYLPEL